jgi:hypothetical protein
MAEPDRPPGHRSLFDFGGGWTRDVTGSRPLPSRGEGEGVVVDP